MAGTPLPPALLLLALAELADRGFVNRTPATRPTNSSCKAKIEGASL
jgi:hypothetical protein